MSPEFNRWYANYFAGKGDGWQHCLEVKDAWTACKEEALKILRKNCKSPNFTVSDVVKAIEMIEEL